MPDKMPGKGISKEREDYIKTIYHLQQDESPVRTTTIARAMKVEPASVTGVIKRLAELGYLDHQPYKGVSLTELGEKIALEVIRHHRLIELYLIEALGYEWDEVHDEAERLEHAVSFKFIERIEKALGNPAIDPHGDPIPTQDGRIEPLTGHPLSQLAVGDTGQVARINDDDAELLRYLGSMGIRPGASIEVLAIAPFHGPIDLLIDHVRCALGPEAAANVFVELN